MTRVETYAHHRRRDRITFFEERFAPDVSPTVSRSVYTKRELNPIPYHYNICRAVYNDLMIFFSFFSKLINV